MFTGLPGTGIGGLFYLVTVVPTMVVVEIGRTAMGKGNLKRARFVFGQALLSLVIVGVYILTGMALQRLLPSQTTVFLGARSDTVVKLVIAFPFALLLTVLSATQILRLILVIQEKFQSRGSRHIKAIVLVPLLFIVVLLMSAYVYGFPITPFCSAARTHIVYSSSDFDLPHPNRILEYLRNGGWRITYQSIGEPLVPEGDVIEDYDPNIHISGLIEAEKRGPIIISAPLQRVAWLSSGGTKYIDQQPVRKGDKFVYEINYSLIYEIPFGGNRFANRVLATRFIQDFNISLQTNLPVKFSFDRSCD